MPQPVIHITPRLYLMVFIALIVLTALTVTASFFELGPWHTVVGLAFGVAKAGLVILIFMHLINSGRFIWLVLAAGLFWFGIMVVLTMSDYLTRPWLTY
ncbi:MAG TPA: cytochrome C oxidase subunit IV family protein [Gemmataceae bacterium]|nr:cytochrome C oxidase subunit IV family protein [Gemmataceae bacterium]